MNFSVQGILQVIVSLAPVFVFLVGLVFLDSFKLVKIRAIIIAVAVGSLAALASLVVNMKLWDVLPIPSNLYPRYFAPVVEESLKALYMVYLIRSRKVGFMVDAALFGFAVGAGFAFVENILVLQSQPDAGLFVWVIRGFGTAVMHGGTTAVFSVISKSKVDLAPQERAIQFLPGLLAAFAIHSFFNHFLLPPELMTILDLIVLPFAMVMVFRQSELATQQWLGVGLDSDVELLEIITKGGISSTKIGTYLRSFERRFRGEVLADMLCYLRIHLELSIKAKMLLLMRSSGFAPPEDPEVQERLIELRSLERNIGKTGIRLMKPFLRSSSQDLWQLHMLKQK
jgi:RsiW-degrading membrane proteinase PrsW (M82 family)